MKNCCLSLAELYLGSNKSVASAFVVEHAHDRNRAGRGSERPKCVAQDGDLVVRHRYHGVIREPNVDAAPRIHSDEGYKAESRFLGRLRRRRAAEKAF